MTEENVLKTKLSEIKYCKMRQDEGLEMTGVCRRRLSVALLSIHGLWVMGGWIGHLCCQARVVFLWGKEPQIKVSRQRCSLGWDGRDCLEREIKNGGRQGRDWYGDKDNLFLVGQGVPEPDGDEKCGTWGIVYGESHSIPHCWEHLSEYHPYHS